MERLMAKGSTSGVTPVKFTRESGTRDSNMDTGFGRVKTRILTSESGGIQRQKATACTFGRTETNTKESGDLVSNMGREWMYLLMETYMLAIL
jgi:hypothetical protein